MTFLKCGVTHLPPPKNTYFSHVFMHDLFMYTVNISIKSLKCGMYIFVVELNRNIDILCCIRCCQQFVAVKEKAVLRRNTFSEYVAEINCVVKAMSWIHLFLSF